MAQGKPEWPETGDLGIATIETVTDYGAYAKQDEYNKRGLLHVSEISSSWIEVLVENYKWAEEVLQKMSQSVITNLTKAGGHGCFTREK